MEEEKLNSTLVTVLIPCYNAMPFLSEALESIINQTYTNLEILCINDGSTDETGDVLEEYAKKDKRIRVIHNDSNLKLIATLNKGIELAKGEYIARMDADDISLNNRIEKLLKEIDKSKADIVSANFQYLLEDYSNINKKVLRCYDEFEVCFASYFFTPIIHAALLGKSETFRRFSYKTSIESIHCEDYELWTRMIREDVKIRNVPDVLYSIRINKNSVSRKFEEEQIKNFTLCANEHQSKLLGRAIPIEITSVAVNRVDRFSIRVLKKGVKLIDEVTRKYLFEYIKDRTAEKNIKTIAAMQKLDVSIQSIKKGKFRSKIYGLKILTVLFFKHLLNKKIRVYFYSKL